MYAKIKSEQTNLAIPERESYLQESILHLQQTPGGKKIHNNKKTPKPRTVSHSRQGQPAYGVSLEDLVYLFFSKEKKLK